MAQSHIVYLGGCWPTNIGNAFIDMGSMQALKMACPDSQISLISEIPRWLFRRKGKMGNALRLDTLVDCDLLVISGVTCSEEFIEIIGPILLDAHKRGVRCLFNGAGQADYTSTETANFRKLLEQADPVAFVSRDSVTFQNMQGCCRSAFDGIDCAFFLPEAYTPARFLAGDYAAVNFDSQPEPRLKLELPVYRAHHRVFEDIRPEYTRHPNTLTSDLPQDYLNLYANGCCTYSDRVHACIATLAYGGKAQLFSSTPRRHLFDRVGATNIQRELTSLDMARLAEMKRSQVEFLRAALNG